MTSGPRIDLRSDFIARPTEKMIAAMVEALHAPGTFGLREDPRQQELERFAADLLGMEDALLFPTCTMANEAAIAVHCRPGDLLLAEAESHIITSEAGGPAALAGVLVRGLPGEAGRMEVAALGRLLATAPDELRARPALVVLETTHNRAGGAALPLDHHAVVAKLAAQAGAAIHVDGARLFNAAAALGVPVADIARHATTVAFSLNKGLAAPAGAMLAGPKDTIRQAAIVRQRFGGGMRPLGFIAAAGLEALRTMPARIAEDHEVAARVATGLVGIAGLAVLAPEPVTNIVVLRIAPALGAPSEFLRRLAAHGVLALPFGADLVRLVFHREIEAALAPRIVAAVAAAARH